MSLLIISAIMAILAVMACVVEGLWLTGWDWPRGQIRIKFLICFCFKLRFKLMYAIGLLVGAGFIAGWGFSGFNWIISDILYTALYIVLNKLVKLASLKTAFRLLLVSMALNISFALLSSLLLEIQINNTMLSIFNNPLFLFCPCISYTINQTCSWLFITSILFPGLLLSYLSRHDARHSSHFYSIVFVACFALSSILWVVALIWVPFTLPYDLVTSPLCMLVVCGVAGKKGEFGALWEGKVYDARDQDRIY